MPSPGTTEAENDPVYQAGMLLAQLWGMLDDLMKGKVAKKEIFGQLTLIRDTIHLVIELLKEAD